MKKLMMMMLLFVMVFPVSVFALDYEIDRTVITAELLTDGNVKVKETHTYSFEGEFNGITRTLIPKENTAIMDVHASENGKDLKVEQEDELYKVHRSGEDETVTIDIFYTIEDGGEVFQDVAQFYWPFFDESNESDYENMTITIVPPEPTEVKAAYGFDEAYNTAQVSGGGEVTFTLGKVSSGENGDIRVAYDASLFPGAPLASDKAMLETIQADKEALDEQVAAKLEQRERWNRFGPFIIGGLLLIAIVISFQAWKKRQETLQEARRQISGTGRFPKTSMSLPAMLAFSSHGQVTTKAVTPALLELVRKGHIEKLSEKEFRVVNRGTEFDHESRLIHWLFDEIGQDGKFHVDDLEVYTKKKDNHERYRKDFNAWRESVRREFRQHKLYETNTKPRWMAGIAAFVTLPFMIVFPVFGVFSWMIAAFVLFAFFLIFAIGYQPLTIEGQRIKQELQPLKLGERWKQWEEEDQIPALLYQVGMGKRNLTSQPSGAFAGSGNDWVIFMLLAATMQSSFQGADKHASVSAATGGMGSAGGGVGGGGGGSGAF
ncbi:hypothetical protein GCM10007216_05500 [Thalassobacillus devorans]|uniref:DUF2207 domain-containing protein n=2 Tax=Thalassobacillus devorans TaxID=279813 RepID=A0ABQ1NI63_9BACI|nr:DUF2207 domain-containing protein [Thalassobacillus devorans]NIK27457.1 putative membrane protein YgcG [Thalassobacillus devorans]GGC77872.1 hypothetical protein GCM10007216_05500 [Thalassobacillus devorans]